MTGNQIRLSQALELTPQVGFFSGYDRILIHDGLGELWSISLPWGDVTSLGFHSKGAHLAVSGAYWGIAEHFDGQDSVVYVRDHTSIARKRLTEGLTTTVASFEDLGDMGAMTVSVPGHRWGFVTTSASQFLDTAPAIGLCDATFRITDQVHVRSIHYEGSTVTLRFPTVAGRLYHLESASDLTGADWVPAPTEFVGTGGIITITEPASVLVNRFYRLRVVR